MFFLWAIRVVIFFIGCLVYFIGFIMIDPIKIIFNSNEVILTRLVDFFEFFSYIFLFSFRTYLYFHLIFQLFLIIIHFLVLFRLGT